MNPSRGTTRFFKATSVAFFFGLLVRLGLAGLILVVLAHGAWAGTWRVRAAEVLDGDTLALASGERLRLRGIDAPEIRHKGRPGQYHGEESRRILWALVKGRDLFLDRSELDTDRYGRLVGQARLGDGRVVSLLLVETGAAFVYPHASDTDRDMARRLLAAQVSAMNRGLGFWPKLLASPGAEKPYVGTRASRRFHTMSCATGRKVKPANQIRFSSLREAFAAGYAPARECTPWPVR
jgi:micrococcal nuclease